MKRPNSLSSVEEMQGTLNSFSKALVDSSVPSKSSRKREESSRLAGPTPQWIATAQKSLMGEWRSVQKANVSEQELRNKERSPFQSRICVLFTSRIFVYPTASSGMLIPSLLASDRVTSSPERVESSSSRDEGYTSSEVGVILEGVEVRSEACLNCRIL